MTRVAVIGLDAMEWEVARRFADEGHMPNLSRLVEEGTFARLENVVAYRSELPWTLFLTGKPPEDNKYWSTVEFDPASYEATMVGAHHAKPFYALGPKHKVIAFDVPHSVPDEAVHGVQVLAWGAHSAQYPRASEPRGLLRQIDAEFGPHPGFDNDYDGAWYVPEYLEKLADAQQEGASRRVDILGWLTEQHPDWDLLVTVMSESHSAGHHMWHGVDTSHPLYGSSTSGYAGDLLRDVYESIDRSIGRLIDGLPDDTIVVATAVHGMQSNANDIPSMVLLPELLHRHHTNGRRRLSGLDTRAWRRGGMRPLVPDSTKGWLTNVRRRFGDGALGRTRRTLTSIVPPAVLERVLRVRRRVLGLNDPAAPWAFRDEIPPETELTVSEVEQLTKPLRWQPPSWYRDEWPEMKWFVVPTFSDAHVRVNLQGREANGVVPPSEYDAACDEFEQLVRACRNPRTGRPAVADVLRVRADDPMDPHGPDSDLVVLWTEPLEAMEHPTLGLIGPIPFNRTGEHSSNGFVVVAGPGIEHADLGTRPALDVTPTILALLDAEPPSGFAGEPIVRAPSGVSDR